MIAYCPDPKFLPHLLSYLFLNELKLKKARDNLIMHILTPVTSKYQLLSMLQRLRLVTPASCPCQEMFLEYELKRDRDHISFLVSRQLIELLLLYSTPLFNQSFLMNENTTSFAMMLDKCLAVGKFPPDCLTFTIMLIGCKI